MSHRIGVILDKIDAPQQSADTLSAEYIEEILQHAGIFYERLEPAKLVGDLEAYRLLILARHICLNSAQRDVLRRYVKSGGSLVGIGGTSGLGTLFGASTKGKIREGAIQVLDDTSHPITSNLRSSLHVFGGSFHHSSQGKELAKFVGPRGKVLGAAIIEREVEKGYTLLFGPDLLRSIVHIQQGIPITQDGKPAPDGSAPLDEGILKTEDGHVLNWEKDRSPIPPDTQPVFLEPIADELRELIIKGVLHCLGHQSIPTPILWYWPHRLKSIAMMSHDSDGNKQDLAWSLLRATDALELKTTWCILYPGGYTSEFYQTLKDRGYEIALHYDALTNEEHTRWSQSDFDFQHAWLLKAADVPTLPSNKNHYTRWENRIEFFRWCEAKGIETEQSKGPSKQGTIGFPLGGSHPWYPIDDEGTGERINVLEINMLTQDLVITCPIYYGRGLVDSVARHHGVAHFLFHPAHIEKPGVNEALTDVVQYARSQGMEWWTSEQIGTWERQRRQIRLTGQQGNGNEIIYRFISQDSVEGATLLLPLFTDTHAPLIRINGAQTDWEHINVYGFDFASVVVDFASDTPVELRIEGYQILH